MGGEAVRSPVPGNQQHPQVLSARTYMIRAKGYLVKDSVAVFLDNVCGQGQQGRVAGHS
jgi:hypothetical protein